MRIMAETYLEMENRKAAESAAAKEAVLTGCLAYPTHGKPAGPTAAWCRSARGSWCGKCKWRNL